MGLLQGDDEFLDLVNDLSVDPRFRGVFAVVIRLPVGPQPQPFCLSWQIFIALAPVRSPGIHDSLGRTVQNIADCCLCCRGNTIIENAVRNTTSHTPFAGERLWHHPASASCAVQLIAARAVVAA